MDKKSTNGSPDGEERFALKNDHPNDTIYEPLLWSHLVNHWNCRSCGKSKVPFLRPVWADLKILSMQLSEQVERGVDIRFLVVSPTTLANKRIDQIHRPHELAGLIKGIGGSLDELRDRDLKEEMEGKFVYARVSSRRSSMMATNPYVYIFGYAHASGFPDGFYTDRALIDIVDEYYVNKWVSTAGLCQHRLGFNGMTATAEIEVQLQVLNKIGKVIGKEVGGGWLWKSVKSADLE